jgi:hypothetical protein
MENRITVRWRAPVPGSGYEMSTPDGWQAVEASRIKAWLARGGMVRYEAAGMGAA